MGGEELALETQLLLQKAAQITQRAGIESVLESASVLPHESELEAATNALLCKLRKKKDLCSAQHQQSNQQRLKNPNCLSLNNKSGLLSPQHVLKLPVAIPAIGASRKKRDLLVKLRTQAIQQKADSLAKAFGYANHEEHIRAIDDDEAESLRASESHKQHKQQESQEQHEQESQEQHEQHEQPNTSSILAMSVAENDEHSSDVEMNPNDSEALQTTSTPLEGIPMEQNDHVNQKSVRRRHRMEPLKAETEDNGNEADSEEDVDDKTETLHSTKERHTMSIHKKDKAAAYRSLLRLEALQHRTRNITFVESEAEEDDDDDVLKIRGLGDFGFGVPQAKTQAMKDAEEERRALTLQEGDLDHIVDDLSDEERAEALDLDTIVRQEQETEDRHQVKEVMRNVKEGFGRNRRAFSSVRLHSEARGRFNLDDLVAADGSKLEAARLGLLASDEEFSDEELHGEYHAKEMDEDEEAEMERILRERFRNQPQIYVTSSESGSDSEDIETKDSNRHEIESDEARERQQIKLFSDRARMNRRMQRMKDLERHEAIETGELDLKKRGNLVELDEEDSHELLQLRNRTESDAEKHKTIVGCSIRGRFDSYRAMASKSQASSSFRRVLGHCKLFGADSNGGAGSLKSFVFTSFGSEKPLEEDESVKEQVCSGKSQSRGGLKRRSGLSGPSPNVLKKQKKSSLFSVLSSYQCVSSTTSQETGV